MDRELRTWRVTECVLGLAAGIAIITPSEQLTTAGAWRSLSAAADRAALAAPRRLPVPAKQIVLRDLSRKDIAAVAQLSSEWAALALPLLYAKLRLRWPHVTPAGAFRGTAGEGDNANDEGTMAEFLSSERHVLGDYEPLPDEIFALTTRDPTDTWNPLRYVRHLDIDYAESHEECLVAIMSALAAAGTRLEKLKIGWLTVSEDVLSALLPLVQDATTSLTLERIVVPHSLNDPFAQLFPRLLSLTIGDFFGVGLLGPKLVALNSKSLTTYAGPPRAIPAGSEIIPTLANHAALRHLSLQLSYNPSDEANFLELLRHRGAGLRSLTVGLYLRPGRDLLRQLLESVPNLVALDIHNFNPHPATSLCDITAIVAPPPIARLCVLGITPDTAAPLIALVKTTLELLLVPEPPRGPDHRQAVAALVAAGPLPALRRLDLRNDEMDPQAVGDLATACPRLRRLCMPVPSSAAAAAPTIAALHLLPHLESVELYPLSTATDPVAVLQASAALAAAHSRLRDVVLTWEGLEQGDDFPEEVRRAEEEAQAASGGRVRIPRRVRDWPASLHSAVQFDQALPFQVGTWPFDLFR